VGDKLEGAWAERHREIMRGRRKERWAARRKALFSPRPLIVLLMIAAAAGYVWQQRAKESEAAGTQLTADSGEPRDRPALDTRRFKRGDCVVWPAQNTAGQEQTRVVPCDEPHLLEVAGSYTAAAGEWPSFQEWDARMPVDCAALVVELVGGPVDPLGRFSVGGLFPGPDGWRLGDRTVWCGAMSAMGVDGSTPVPFTGLARAHNQALVYEVGACGNWDHRGPVACQEPHDFEVAGSVDLAGKVQAPPAAGDSAGWERLVGSPCLTAVRKYLGYQPNDEIRVSYHTLAPESWAAGRRVAECFVIRYQGETQAKSTGPVPRR
jgi:Septum formation